MPNDWSRRALLASFAATLAGCTAGPGTPTTREPTATPDSSPSPPKSSSPTPSDGVERLPADDPALAWAVRLPEPVANQPAVDPDGSRVYVGTGENRVGTPTADDRESTAGAVFSLRATDGRVAWRAATEAPVVEEPVVHDGRVHAVTGYSTGFSGRDQRIVAYGRDGTRQWATDPTNGFLSVVAENEGTLFVGTGDDALGVGGETLFAVEGNGDVRWEREAGDAMGATVADGRLLYSAGGQALASYDPADGTEGWQTPGEPLGNPTTSVAAFEGLCFTQSPEKAGEGYPLVARSTADGSEQWRYSTAPASGENFVPTGVANVPESIDAANYDHPLVGTEFGGTVFALGDGGREGWTFEADADTRAGPAVGDAIYVGDSEGTVYALEPIDGRERWRASLPRFARVRPLSSGVLAVSAGRREHVVASFTSDGSERWRYTTSKDLTTVAVAGDRAYAGASDGTVLAFATGAGE